MNKITYLVAHIVTFLCGLLITISLPYLLSSNEYNTTYLMISLLNVLIPIGSFGLTPFIIRYFKKAEVLNLDLFSISISLLILGSAFVCVAISFFSAFDLYDFKKTTLAMIWLSVSFGAVAVVLSAFYRASNNAKSYFIIVAGSKLLFIPVVMLGIYLFSHQYLNVYLISSVISVAFFFPFLINFKYFRKLFLLPNLFNFKDFFNSVRFCVPVLLANILVMGIPLFERSYLVSKADENLLAQYIFNYELSLKITGLILLVMKILIWPYITDKDESQERKKYVTVGKFLIPSLCVMVFLVVISEPLYGFFVLNINEAFVNHDIFILCTLYSAFLILNYYINLSFLLTEKSGYMTKGSFLSLLLHVIFIDLFFDRFGVYGVLISASTSMLLSMLIVFILNYKNFRRFGGLNNA